MGVIECLGELADHLQTGLDGQVGRGWSRHEVVEPLPVLAVLEDDGRAGRSSSLYCSARTMPSWVIPCSARYSRCAARWTDFRSSSEAVRSER